jgi:hypothetical protein
LSFQPIFKVVLLCSRLSARGKHVRKRYLAIKSLNLDTEKNIFHFLQCLRVPLYFNFISMAFSRAFIHNNLRGNVHFIDFSKPLEGLVNLVLGKNAQSPCISTSFKNQKKLRLAILAIIFNDVLSRSYGCAHHNSEQLANVESKACQLAIPGVK